MDIDCKNSWMESAERVAHTGNYSISGCIDRSTDAIHLYRAREAEQCFYVGWLEESQSRGWEAASAHSYARHIQSSKQGRIDWQQAHKSSSLHISAVRNQESFNSSLWARDVGKWAGEHACLLSSHGCVELSDIVSRQRPNQPIASSHRPKHWISR